MRTPDRMAFENLYGYGLLLGMLGVVVTTMIYVTIAGTNMDSSQQTISQIQSMAIANFIMICIFGYLVSFFLASYPSMTESYILFMLHASVFLSLMAVSIAALQQV